MNDLSTKFEPDIFVDFKGDIDLLSIYSKNTKTLTAPGSFPYLGATTSEGEKNDDLQRPPLPEEELPEDDDSEQTGGASADSPTGSQPQAMPGWFKLALVVALIILLSVGYVGYLYLRGELSFGNTAGGSVTEPPVVQPPSTAGGQQAAPDQESAPDTTDPQATGSHQPNQPAETESEDYTIREAVEPALPRLNLPSSGEKAAANTATPSSSPSPTVEKPGAQNGRVFKNLCQTRASVHSPVVSVA